MTLNFYTLLYYYTGIVCHPSCINIQCHGRDGSFKYLAYCTKMIELLIISNLTASHDEVVITSVLVLVSTCVAELT